MQRSLDDLRVGTHFNVQRVSEHPDNTDWRAWLEEIGFLPGEEGKLVARGMPGGDPLVVRIGLSTFALRRAEAACVMVEIKEERAQSAA